MRATIPVLALLAAGCTNDLVLGGVDKAPVVTILSPEDGDAYELLELVELAGAAEDGNATQELIITWTSSLDGELGGEPPDAEGITYLGVNDLTEGSHVLTLEALDAAGQLARDSVGITVGDGIIVADPGPPTVVLQSPTDGAVVMRDDNVAIVGTIADAEDSHDLLVASLSDSVSGVLWEGSPSATGSVTYDTTALSVGPHTLTLTAVDTDGNLSSDIASFHVENDGRPFAQIDLPMAGASALMTDPIRFEGTVWDLEDVYPTDLAVEWTSDRDGVLPTAANPDSAGYTALIQNLSAGPHLITLRVTDTDGQYATDTVLLDIQDPNDVDMDGDGWTPNQGDCDDGDTAVSPDATEICDNIDNDCDGVINNGWEDAQEFDGLGGLRPNDTYDTYYDMGEVDSELPPLNASVNIAGLTLHHPGDEDWFLFYADDEFEDPSNPRITVDLPATGNFTATLYFVGANQSDAMSWPWEIEQSKSGNGTLTLRCSNNCDRGLFAWDEDEDWWGIKIVANTWPAASCSTTYDLTVREN